MTHSILLLLSLMLSAMLFSQTFSGKIIGVKDGDTVVILFENKPQTIRLAHVDCPEKKQPFGDRAKRYTSNFCFGKTVKVVLAGKPDRNGRWIAEIFRNNQNLGKQLVRQGLAWHFKKYSGDDAYAELERTARARKTGLWAEAQPIAPWDWRKYPDLRKPQVKVLRKSA